MRQSGEESSAGGEAMSDWSCSKCNLRSGQTCADRDCPGLAKAMGMQPLSDPALRGPGGKAMSDEQKALVQQAVDRMRVDLADGYRLAAKVALAALEPSDGTYYSRDITTHRAEKIAHERVKQKLQEAAEAWGITMTEPPHD
jgi:hypothetical protein